MIFDVEVKTIGFILFVAVVMVTILSWMGG